MAKESRWIRLRGVRVHNLKGIDLDLPLNRLIALTGVSGSGKSSLAFDTLFAEGQRRYIETFSAYTRQFLDKLDKPDADRIDGIPPAIAVAQRWSRRSSRSTVGTVTEVHDHLALLFAKLGNVVCHRCGHAVEPATPELVAGEADLLPQGTHYLIGFPLEVRPESDRASLATALREDGFFRIRVAGEVRSLDGSELPLPPAGVLDVIVDRLVRGNESPARRLDSIETAMARGFGRCRVITDESEATYYQGWRCAQCGADYLEPTPRLFQFNNAVGACPTCEGFGRMIDLDLSRIVPDPSKSLSEGAIAPWTTPAYSGMLQELLELAPRLNVPTNVPFKRLTAEQARVIVEGSPAHGYSGLRGFFRWLEKKAYKLHTRVFLSRWRGYKPCLECHGARLRPEALAVKVGGLDVASVSAMRIRDALRFLEGRQRETRDNPVARRILEQAQRRLDYLERIGLDYLTLDRAARTLSVGEAQRVALTSALGSGLVNTLYVLDEPSVGLHPSDVARLIAILHDLRDEGNTVVVVEHDHDVIRSSDLVVDIGPGAGEAGGQVLFVGPPDRIDDAPGSVTGDFLSGRKRIGIPDRRRAVGQRWLRLQGARGHNLKNIDVAFPLGVLCVVTGVSGAGKSTLVEETLYPALYRRLGGEPIPAEPHTEIVGTGELDEVVLVDQSPIGRSSRSNPVTYLKAFDEIRKVFAATNEAKLRGYGASQFSFNVVGGRCNACEGNGFLVIDMQFLADVMVRCTECHGARYRPETLQVTYRGRNIAEVLDLTAREAFVFFRHRPKVQARLRPLLDVGLDYVRLGQPASTLSGGEAQRLKLASHLATSPAAMVRASGSPRTLFILDEPTTGLHSADTLKLLDALNSLLVFGHSLIVVEHSPEMMASADWIIDLGPGAGDEGGTVVAQGTPEEVAKTNTPTGRVLHARLSQG
ncbi:MAG: excinuclease ABC subunit UvrA [Isosphaeraceae bacterium]|nr:excinuclease ABC subunit UvrA [Isosphaeraceae bacterium]